MEVKMKRSTVKIYHRGNGRLNVMRRQMAMTEQKNYLSPQRLRYRGIALVWTALVVFMLFLFVGLTIDWGKLMYNLSEMQNAADAAALAGAQIVKDASADETRQLTHDTAYLNTAEKLRVTLSTDVIQYEPFEENPDLDIILGRWINHQHYFFETLDTPDAVKVIAKRTKNGLDDMPPLSFLYGPLCKVYKADAHRTAIGWDNEASGAGLIVLDTDPNDIDKPVYTPRPGLFINDNTGKINVINGTIQVNTTWQGMDNDPAAVEVKAGGKMDCGRLTVTGNADPEPGSSLWEKTWQIPYDIDEGAPFMPDPLGPQGANIQPPVISEYEVRSYEKNTPGTLYPGYYPDGIVITSNASSGMEVTFTPGTYIIGGGNDKNQESGLILNGGDVEAEGVLFYITKDFGDNLDDPSDDGNWGILDIGGKVITNITPQGDLPENYVNGKPVIDGLLGVSIWQDRANHNQASLHGESGVTISGTLYFPNNHCYLAGNPGKTGNQILCGSVGVYGNSKILVEYDGRNNISIGISVLVQ
jgi:hypothetical protein